MMIVNCKWGGGCLLLVILLLIINNSPSSTSDCIQLAGTGDPTGNTRPPITVANNLMMALPRNAGLATGINVTGGFSNSYLIYNNIMLMRTEGNTLHSLYLLPSSARIFNNTILTTGDGRNLQLAGIDTLILKNNVLVIDSNVSQNNLLWHQGGYADIVYKDINYNLYYKPGSVKIKPVTIKILLLQNGKHLETMPMV